MIDIFIPPSQIIDTVNIYHLPHRQRKLSLRFLAWAVLHSAIQTDTHDSIEDARTALQLYETQNRLEAEGTWEEVLEEVYRDGRLTVRSSFLPIIVFSIEGLDGADEFGECRISKSQEVRNHKSNQFHHLPLLVHRYFLLVQRRTILSNRISLIEIVVTIDCFPLLQYLFRYSESSTSRRERGRGDMVNHNNIIFIKCIRRVDI